MATSLAAQRQQPPVTLAPGLPAATRQQQGPQEASLGHQRRGQRVRQAVGRAHPSGDLLGRRGGFVGRVAGALPDAFVGARRRASAPGPSSSGRSVVRDGGASACAATRVTSTFIVRLADAGDHDMVGVGGRTQVGDDRIDDRFGRQRARQARDDAPDAGLALEAVARQRGGGRVHHVERQHERHETDRQDQVARGRCRPRRAARRPPAPGRPGCRAARDEPARGGGSAARRRSTRARSRGRRRQAHGRARRWLRSRCEDGTAPRRARRRAWRSGPTRCRP